MFCLWTLWKISQSQWLIRLMNVAIIASSDVMYVIVAGTSHTGSQCKARHHKKRSLLNLIWFDRGDQLWALAKIKQWYVIQFSAQFTRLICVTMTLSLAGPAGCLSALVCSLSSVDSSSPPIPPAVDSTLTQERSATKRRLTRLLSQPTARVGRWANRRRIDFHNTVPPHLAPASV